MVTFRYAKIGKYTVKYKYIDGIVVGNPPFVDLVFYLFVEDKQVHGKIYYRNMKGQFTKHGKKVEEMK